MSTATKTIFTDITAVTAPPFTTWFGGRGNYRDAADWSHGSPQAGAIAYIPYGTVIAANQTIAGSTLELDAYAPQVGRTGDPAGVTLTLTGATLAASETVEVALSSRVVIDAGVHSAQATIAVVGPVFNQGNILVPATAGSTDTLTITVTDITARSGATIAAGVLNNSGLIETEGGLVVFTGATTDTALVNDGTIEDNGAMVVDIALTGTGLVTMAPPSTGATPTLELTRAVSAGQTFDLGGVGALRLDDPTDFKGTIRELNGASVQLMNFVALSETFADGELTLVNGNQTVTLALPGWTSLDQFAITSASGNTLVTTALSSGPSTLASPPSGFPTPLVDPAALPPVYTNGYLTSGAVTGYDQIMHGTILLGGTNGSTVPSVNIAQVILAADSVIASNAAPTTGTSTPYATVNTVGGNRNDGLIDANSQKGLFRLSVDDLRSGSGSVLEAGVLKNVGTIAATHDHLIVTGVSTDTALVNSGLISAAGHATIDLNIAVMGLGSIQLLSGSTLNVGGSLGAQQTVSMGSDAGTTLALANVQSVASSITDFGAGDTIQLTNQDFDIANYAGNTLSLTGSSGTASLSVIGAGSAANFAVNHADGSTFITHVG